MRIRAISTAVIEANYDWTLVRVETDDGVSGLGEAFCAPGLTATIRELAPLLVGHDARQVEPLVRRLRLSTAHAGSWGGTVEHAISGIEAALWDTAARLAEVPLWQLWGGRYRDRVRIYADCHAGDALVGYSPVLVARRPSWAAGSPASDAEGPEYHWSPREDPDVYRPEAYAARARQMAGRGFTALKFDLDLPLLPGEDLHARTIAPDQMARQIAIARAAVDGAGRGVDVAFDLHWRYAPADALRLAVALEDLPLLWLEDPVPPADLAAVAGLSTRTTTPIATGENLYLLSGFEALIQAGGVDILAPDIQKVGGLAEARRIAHLADAHSLPIAPHNISGPIGTMAAVQVCASIPNFLVLEWHAASVPFFDSLVVGGGPLIDGGYVTVPDGPGLGIELDLEEARRYALPGEPFFA